MASILYKGKTEFNGYISYWSDPPAPIEPEPWNPSLISTALWLDASVPTSITLDSGAVSQWDDLSGNNRHVTQSTSTKRPTYTDQFSVDFDGVNDELRGASASTGFFIAVITPFGYQSFGASLGFTSRHGVIRDDISNVWYHSTASLFPSSTARRNGQLSLLLADVRAIFSNGGTATSVAISLGKDDAGANFAACNIHEVVLTANDPSTGDRQKLEGYLAHKWGLTGGLASDHPYKTSYPLF
ncbi:hypothetical protein H6G45_09290 [Synechocystis sp. FACHB-383]|uniref:hypothetical protein n=1 Tax=Synechocystis sp. FACHB-383 TaxID=2692864 RepID=UPI0016889251|nr:hypothetical protein [Synechocystis sp. FACHB-383]MBD2653680.1 hypothetical protein [Synechocystis sp. FACHB-383]